MIEQQVLIKTPHEVGICFRFDIDDDFFQDFFFSWVNGSLSESQINNLFITNSSLHDDIQNYPEQSINTLALQYNNMLELEDQPFQSEYL